MRILALDTATHTGWAVYASGVTTSGVEDFSIRTQATKTKPADHPGKRFALFRAWLKHKVREDKIDLIVYEAIVGGRMAGGNTSLLQKGLEAIVLEVAYDASYTAPIPVWSFAAATIKKFATGNGKLTHESKQEMVTSALVAFRDQEFVPHNPTKSQPWMWDDNQCDALWILALARAVVYLIEDKSTGTHWQPSMTDCLRLTSYAHEVIARKWSRR